MHRLSPLVVSCLLVTAAAIPALDYARGPGDETLAARRDIHRGILNQTTRVPDRYRWLAAAIVELPTRLLATAMPYEVAFDRASTVFYLAAFTALLWSLFAYLRLWFTDEQALIGALIVACTIRITLRQHDYAPYSYLEASLFALGLLAIARRWLVLFYGLVTLAAFNRETGIFLVALYVATNSWSRQTASHGAALLLIWGAIFAGTRIVGGEAERYWSLERVLNTNLSQPGLAAFNITLFLGAFWWLALRGWHAAPEFVRRSARVAPIYLFTVAVWGIWWEVRLLMPIYPIVVPLALSCLFKPHTMRLDG